MLELTFFIIIVFGLFCFSLVMGIISYFYHLIKYPNVELRERAYNRSDLDKVSTGSMVFYRYYFCRFFNISYYYLLNQLRRRK